MMRRPATIAGVVIYFVVAILTFGQAAIKCRACDNTLQASMIAMMGAALWPLWWSWELQARR